MSILLSTLHSWMNIYLPRVCNHEPMQNHQNQRNEQHIALFGTCTTTRLWKISKWTLGTKFRCLCMNYNLINICVTNSLFCNVLNHLGETNEVLSMTNIYANVRTTPHLLNLQHLLECNYNQFPPTAVTLSKFRTYVKLFHITFDCSNYWNKYIQDRWGEAAEGTFDISICVSHMNLESSLSIFF